MKAIIVGGIFRARFEFKYGTFQTADTHRVDSGPRLQNSSSRGAYGSRNRSD